MLEKNFPSRMKGILKKLDFLDGLDNTLINSGVALYVEEEEVLGVIPYFTCWWTQQSAS